MKKAYLILMLVILSACRAKQVTNESHYQEQTKEQKDVTDSKSTINEDQVREAIKRIIDEELEVNVNKVTYDTDKPKDPDTGKHPIKEESNANIKKKSTTSEESNKEENSTSQIEEKTEDKGTIEKDIDQSAKGTEIVEQSTFEKVLGLLPLLGLALVVFVIVIGARKLYLKYKK